MAIRRSAMLRSVLILLSGALLGVADAAPAPALTGFPIQVPVQSAFPTGAGFSNMPLPSVTPEDFRAVIKSRTIPANLNALVPKGTLEPYTTVVKQADGKAESIKSAIAAPTTMPAELIELARALKGDPDLIFEYVRNNIEYYPVWGIQKGALGAMLDKQGTAFDQVALMSALLTISNPGLEQHFVTGVITLDANQVQSWLGVDTSNANPNSACAVSNLLSFGQVPVMGIGADVAGIQCPAAAHLLSVQMQHVWLSAGGHDYDPSFKPHNFKPAINLAGITGYTSQAYLGTAQTNEIKGTTYTVTGLNRTGIRSTLNGYAKNLASYLRTNLPAATLSDVVGGKTIIPYSNFANFPTYNSPHLVFNIQTFTDLTQYKPTVEIQYQGIDQPFTSDALYGNRTTITYQINGTSYTPVLTFTGPDSIPHSVTGTAFTPGSSNPQITFTVHHPAYASAPECPPGETPPNCNMETFSQDLLPGGTYLVATGWGPTGRGSVDYWKSKLNTLLAANGGVSTNSEPMAGASLSLLASSWLAEVAASDNILNNLAQTQSLVHHQIGIAGINAAPYVDLPGLAYSVMSNTNNAAVAESISYNQGMHHSIFESIAVQQIAAQQGSSASAVSTVKLFDTGSQISGQGFIEINSSSLSEIGSNLQLAISAGRSAKDEPFIACYPFVKEVTPKILDGTISRVIMPTDCVIAQHGWTGYGFFTIANSASTGKLQKLTAGICGGINQATCSAMNGGDFDTPETQEEFDPLASENAEDLENQEQKTPSGTTGDPIDMANGNFLYDRADIKVGVGDFPFSLSFRRQYSSGLRSQGGTMGKGWTHNLNVTATPGSDILQGMGEDSGLDAVNAIVEKMVSLDLMSDPAHPLDTIATVALGQSWLGDQLVSNTVLVNHGLNGELFVLLPDGSYNPPPGSSSRLVLNADATYSYSTANQAVANFDATGKIISYQEPNGVQAQFSYSGGNLASVQNSLGHTLTLTTPSGLVTRVSDENGRSVGYGYDGSSELTSFTDANQKTTTFTYVPTSVGSIYQIFYPNNPGHAFLTNSYDTLGRVNSQIDANGYKYNYFFAGSRSEEDAPDGSATVSYLDPLSHVIRSIDAMGRETDNTYDGQGRVIKSVVAEGRSVSALNPPSVEFATSSINPGASFQYTYDDATCASLSLRCTHNVRSISRYPRPGSTLPVTTTNYTYESKFNKIATAQDARLQTTNYTYTDQGYPWVTTSPADASGVHPTTTSYYTRYTAANGLPNFYMLASQTSNITSSDAVTTSYTYNTGNHYVPYQVTIDSGGLNLVTTSTYDGIGNLTLVDGPRGDVNDTTAFSYDYERRIAQITNAAGKLTKTTYDEIGQAVRVSAQQDARWLVSCKSYTPSGKVLSAWGPGVTSSDATCPAAAAPVSVTGYTYDNRDRNYQVTVNLQASEGGNRVTQTDYFADGKVKDIKKAVGNALAQTYVTYAYDPYAGKAATVADAKGNLTTYKYDDDYRLAYTYFPTPGNGPASSSTDYEQYTYDNNDNVTALRKRNGQAITFGFDNLNRTVSRTYPVAANNIAYAYDLLGRRTCANYTSCNSVVTNIYDHAGRLTSTTAGSNTLTFKYDAAGNRTRTTWPDGFYVTYDYDAMNRPIDIKENGSVNLVNSFVYDDLSRRSVVNFGNSTATSYGYDNQSRLSGLTNGILGAGKISYGYTYDQAGERLGQSWSQIGYQWTGYSNGNQSYTANGQNQYSSVAGVNMGYDANGNMTNDGSPNAYTYDLDNHMVSASGFSSLAYDAMGRLSQTTLSGIVTNLVYDGDRLVAEYDGSNKLLRRYVHGPRGDEPLVWYEGAGTANKSWLYADHLGSVVATANAQGNSTATYSYGPHGEPNVTAGVRFRYTGQQLIGPLNLYYYKSRFYSSNLGRFMQTDPIGYQDNINWYAYAGNNPINFHDQTGKEMDPAASEEDEKVDEDELASDFVGPGIGKSGFKSTSALANAAFVQYQSFVDQGYARALSTPQPRWAEGLPQATWQGILTDQFARTSMNEWLENEGLGGGEDDMVAINRYLRDPTTTATGAGTYRIPDVNISGASQIFDATIGLKTWATPQVQDFVNFSGGSNVTIVRPTTIGEIYTPSVVGGVTIPSWTVGSYSILFP